MRANRDLRIYRPATLAEAAAICQKNPEARLCAGGTARVPVSASRDLGFSGGIITISHLAELKHLARNERWLDLGSALSLGEICDRGRKLGCDPLLDAALLVGNAPLRNLATIGGNVCARERHMDLYTVLSLLDAQAEIRRDNSLRWAPVSRLHGERGSGMLEPGSGLLEPGEIITRFRLPHESWDLSLVRKTNAGGGYPDERGYLFVCLARARGNSIVDIKIAFSGHEYLRLRDLENGFAGKQLPLRRSDIEHLIDQYREATSEGQLLPRIARAQFTRLLDWALSHLSS